MKKEDLADAMEGIFDSDLEEVDALRNAPRTPVVRKFSRKKRILILVAACVLLLGAGFAYRYLMRYPGEVDLTDVETSLFDSTGGYFTHLKIRDTVISWKEMKGEIRNTLPELAAQMERAARIPRQSEANDIARDPDYFEGIKRDFSTIGQAAVFVGYAGLKTPTVDLGEGSRTQVILFGEQQEELPYRVMLSTIFGQNRDGIYASQTIELHISEVMVGEGRNGEDDEITNGYLFSQMNSSEITATTVEENGREFKVFKGRYALGAGMATTVSWVENKAIYTLWMRWPDDQEAAADAKMLEWMRSF